jgi:hypothetical protein
MARIKPISVIFILGLLLFAPGCIWWATHGEFDGANFYSDAWTPYPMPGWIVICWWASLPLLIISFTALGDRP